MDRAWFEMEAIRKRRLNAAVWIPLRAMDQIERTGRFGFLGFKEEFFGAGSLAVPHAGRDAANQLTWSDIGISHQHGPYATPEAYVPSDLYESHVGDFQGLHLVLEQRINSSETSEWHLNQDLVLALRLKREGDVWVSPNEGYLDVVRLKRRPDGSPFLMEIRAEHLRDYLCARGMALYVTSYRNRQIVVEDAGFIDWPANPMAESHEGDRWEGRVYDIHEGGERYGAKTAVFHVARTDVDPEEEVPTFGPPTDDGTTSRSWTIEHEGQRLFVVQGELWRNEWVEPAATSPRVRGDTTPPSVFFVTDAEGKRESGETLITGQRWLWFRPEVMMALAHRRGGGIGWYTRHTGSVWCSPDYGVHFGENRLGLINVYAKDIAQLPEWQQRIWAGHNLGPDGGVSDELLASQVRADPADTRAPEAFLPKGLDLVRTLAAKKFGVPLLREHDQLEEILGRCHRFRAVDRAGLFALAKDLARLTADSIDAARIHELLGLAKDDRPGSLKSLERLLAERVGPESARRLVGPLVGIYELRLADAHLPSSEVADSFALAQVREGDFPIQQGFQLLDACVATIYSVAKVLRDWEASS